VAVLVTVLVAVVTAVGLVACGSDSGDSGGPVSLEDTRTEAQLADDRAAAGRALLVLDDFPPGWTAEPREEDIDDEAPDLEVQMAECLEVDPALMGEAAVEVDSDTFSFDGAEVESNVAILPTVAYADDTVAAFFKPQAQSCFEDVFRDVMEYTLANPGEGEVLPEGVSFGEIQLDDLDFPDVGEDSRAFRVSMPIRMGLLSIDLYYDLVFVRVGRAMGSVTFLDDTTPFGAELAEDLARTFAARLPKA
jgi:hypothetical protein